MFYRITPEEVDMVELFPNSKDYKQTFLEHPIPRHTPEEAIAHFQKHQEEE